MDGMIRMTAEPHLQTSLSLARMREEGEREGGREKAGGRSDE
jgi:hypothetical protein